ncbi:MAG: ribosome maturation factor RimM [Candidatus Promineifilaceae bacterium]
MIIGRIRKPHGVRGELKVSILSELPERFLWLEQVHYARRADDQNPSILEIETIRFHQEDALIKFAGYDGRDAAGVLRQHYLLVPIEEAIPLEEGEYYTYQIIGLNVYTESGDHLGVVSDLIETGANDVFVVDGKLGELLIPDTKEVVKKIDIEAKQIMISPIDGLLPEGK